MELLRRRGVIIALVIILIIGFTAGSIAIVLSSRQPDEPPVDRAKILEKIPEAEALWFSQPQDAKDEVCGGLASSPDEYYALMQETWLDGAGIEPELFGALMTTIINDCGL